MALLRTPEGKRAGGLALAAKMTAEERIARARAGGLARAAKLRAAKDSGT